MTRGVHWLLALAGILVGCGAGHPAAGPAEAALLSWEEYAKLRPQWPYILEIQGPSGGALLYFGAAHSSDPSDPQFAQIEQLWADFGPDIVFNEGGDPPAESDRDTAIRKYGEPGLLRHLAARDSLPIHSLDPTPAEQVAAISPEVGSRDLKMFYLMRAVSQHNMFERDRTVGEHLAGVLKYYGRVAGLDGSPVSEDEIQAALDEIIPGNRGYLSSDPAWFDPVRSDTRFNAISRSLNRHRDNFMVDLLVSEVLSGKRVFAVVGGTHVVMQEPLIRNRLRASR